MRVRKLSVSLKEEVARAAVRVAEAEGVSVSTWLNRAAEHAIRIADGRAAVREYFADHGEPDDSARAQARRIVGELLAGEPQS